MNDTKRPVRCLPGNPGPRRRPESTPVTAVAGIDARTAARRGRPAWFLLVSLGVLAALVSPVWATFHLARIDEIFLGMPGHTDAQYLTIVPYSNFQNLFSTVQVTVYGSTGTQLADFAVFGANLPSSTTNQKSILVATSAAQSLFGIAAEQTATGALPSSGVVCFRKGLTVVDCVSYGAYTGSTTAGGSQAGPPAPAVPLGQALRRDFGTDGVLSATDDTDNSAADFDLTAPRPRNFAGIETSDLTVAEPGGTLTVSWAGTSSITTIHRTDDPSTVRTSAAVATVVGTSWVDPTPDLFPAVTYYVVKP